MLYECTKKCIKTIYNQSKINIPLFNVDHLTYNWHINDDYTVEEQRTHRPGGCGAGCKLLFP